MSTLAMPRLVPRPITRDQAQTSMSPDDSPGRDVTRDHPTLPDDVYRRAVQNAMTRENATRDRPAR